MSTSIPPSPIERRRARVWRISLGAILLLMGAVNSVNVNREPGDLAGALGALTGVLILLVFAVWLIASGLPRSIGTTTDLKKIRRRIWYKLAGGGLIRG